MLVIVEGGLMKKQWVFGLAILMIPHWSAADATGPIAVTAPASVSTTTASHFNPLVKAKLDQKTLTHANSGPPSLGFKFKPQELSATGSATTEIHSATGTIVAFSDGNKTVTINHGAFADNFMGAKESTFQLLRPSSAARLKVGQYVQFSLQKIGDHYSIWSIQVYDK